MPRGTGPRRTRWRLAPPVSVLMAVVLLAAGPAVGSGHAPAQNPDAPATVDDATDPIAPPSRTHPIPAWDRVMVDISPVMALIGFYGFRATIPVSERGRVIAGYMYQNFRNDLGRSHSHALLVGYQHYLWRGLEVELELWPGYNNWHSAIDDEWYPGPELWAEARIGYRLEFDTRGVVWYLLPQLLAGKGLWDGFDAPGDFGDPFFFPALWVGFPIQ